MSNNSPFDSCADHLAQGDIFAIPLIAPYAESNIRIFRAIDGAPAYKVFKKDLEGRVYDLKELCDCVQQLPVEDRIFPFDKKNDYPHEYVIVRGDLLEFVIIASQTCDISGVDCDPKPFATVLPIITVAHMLAKEKYPIDVQNITDFDSYQTIVQYLEQKFGNEIFKEIINDPYELPGVVYALLKKWRPTKRNGEEKRIRTAIKHLLTTSIHSKKIHTHYLPCEKALGVPEGYVDFCRLYTLPTEELKNLASYRMATLATLYREQFAEKLAHYLSRIATPTPLGPQPIK